MEAFDERETVSAPHELSPEGVEALLQPVWGIRVYGDDLQLEIPPEGEPFNIGSAAGNDLRLDDRYVSGAHCSLVRQGNALLVRDRRSKNGTFVNGNRVQVAEVRVGALLTVGQTRLLVLARPMAAARSALEQLRGKDDKFRAAIELALRAARADCNVLVLGETGTGKELFARLVHEASRRLLQPFVAVNCGAIPRELIGSELFGHERGAFTGAEAERDGVFAQAHGGTLFLDEIGELPLHQQPHLLRVLETGRVRRIGAQADRRVDVRVVSATNRTAGGGGHGALRQDLYHRLATVVIELPPLRARRRDIPLLVQAFLDELEPSYGVRRVGKHTLRTLQRYPWPGNVRELRHAVKRAVAMGGEELTIGDFLPDLAPMEVEPEPPEPRRRNLAFPVPPPSLVAAGRPPQLSRCDEVVRDLIVDALERNGSIRAAARELGVSKSTLADRIQRYGIAWPKTRLRRLAG